MKLTPLEHEGQRVLITAQLAESFGTDAKNINDNFQNNRDRYREGKHYFELKGDKLKSFKASTEISGNLKFAPVIQLWTEKGAWMHAKSLNTDRAWEAYEVLVDDYYRVKHHALPAMTQAELIAAMANQNVEQERRIKALEDGLNEAAQTMTTVKETFLQRDDDWRQSINKLLNGAAYRFGGGYQDLRNRSYAMLEDRGRCDLDKRLRNLVERLEVQGATKTQLKKTTKMDVIEADPRLKEIYTTIVKELSIASLS